MTDTAARSVPLAIDHVQIAAPAGAEPAARMFYGDVLGLKEVPKPRELAVRGGAWFVCGAQQIHVGIEAEFRPAKKAHLALRVANREDLAALRARLEQRGIFVRDEPGPPDVARFYADDPWGNRLEFLSA